MSAKLSTAFHVDKSTMTQIPHLNQCTCTDKPVSMSNLKTQHIVGAQLDAKSKVLKPVLSADAASPSVIRLH